MSKYLDPKNDLIFKRVFGEHKHLCISLLNSMLPLDPSQPVVSIEYQTNELLPELDILRNSIVDVRCTDSTGRQFIVEMQLFWSKSFESRVLLNAAKSYAIQLHRADRFSLLHTVYALSFVNDNFDPALAVPDDYYHLFRIMNVRDNSRQMQGMVFVFVELKKFVPKGRAEAKLHELWLRYLTEINENTEEIPRELLEHRDVQEAVKYAEVAAYTKEQLMAYDKVRDSIITERSVMSDAEIVGMEKGREEGREEGIEIGIERGREEGIEIGREKGVEKGIEAGLKKVAVACLKKGMPVEEICELTGLTEEAIRGLQESPEL
jgi:predicted transposase/invertase (TIGR01784 family)